MDEYIKKMWQYTHTHKYNSARKGKEILLHATTQMDLEDVILSEISLSWKNRYYTIPIMWRI